MNRTYLIFAALLVAFGVVGAMDAQDADIAAARDAEITSTVADVAAAREPLSMPCTWVSITGALEPLQPRCVDADLRGR